MFSARTILSTFANATGCGRQFALALVLLFCQLTYFAVIVDATLDLSAVELLQHAPQRADNYVKNGDNAGGDNDAQHSMPYKQLMSQAFDAYELPPSVEDEQQYDDSAEITDSAPDMSSKAKQAIMSAFPPAAATALFMQMHNEQKQHKQQPHMHKSSAAKLQQQHLTAQQQHRRHCNIEISTKIPGFCQSMQPIGSACVSGEYMDVFNIECM